MAFFLEISSSADPVPLAGTVEIGKPKTRKPKAPKLSSIPPEHLTLEKARATWKSRASLKTIEEMQREILLARTHFPSKGVEREFDEFFYALEIRKGIALTRRHRWKGAFESYQRGLSGLISTRWPLYWQEEASQQLSLLCLRDPKKKDEDCLGFARKIAEAFPKAALETKALRELPAPESGSPTDSSGERLSASYPEKLDRDEAAFQELLAFYLKGKESDFKKALPGFFQEFPRSSFRFRLKFLQAELLFRGGSANEAAPLYESIIEDTPLSYHSILAGERLGLDFRSRIRKEPILVDLQPSSLLEAEKTALGKAILLLQSRRFEGLGLELESFTRSRAYSTDFLMYLMRLASVGNQHMITFKLANELIQRKAPQMSTQEMLDLLFPEVYVNEIQAEASATGLDPLLILSLIKQESGFKPTAVSSSGALGLMQLMPFTAIDVDENVRLSALIEPLVNISTGIRYLKSLMDRYEGNVVFSLAAYNAGPHRVAKWRKEALPGWSLIDWVESIPFKETRDYVSSILRHRYWYQVQKGIPVSKITELKSLTPIPTVDKN